MSPGWKCDAQGNFLPEDAEPPAPVDPVDFTPFDNRQHFHFTEWHFEKVQTSEGDLNELLNNLAAQKATDTGDPTAKCFYRNAEEMHATIDAIQYDGLPWMKFHFKYNGPIHPQTPVWKLQTYTVYACNPLHVAEYMGRCTDFQGAWDNAPYEEHTNDTCRRICDFMSARFPYRKAVSHHSFTWMLPTIELAYPMFRDGPTLR